MLGETIGNFKLTKLLGRGGMGEVYLGEHTGIGTKVAIKVLLRQISEDTDHVQRFFNEARAVAKIQHAGIVRIFDVGFYAEHAYLVMEFLDGESLAARLDRQGRLSGAQTGELGRQIASVLDATHGAGITHRDLKPDNIYIVPDRELASRERIKILDFGIAKLTGTLLGAGGPRTEGSMGTPGYMAPEQWGDASKADARADIYSLGCVAFEMACGQTPFKSTTLAEACASHLMDPPPHARTIAPDVPEPLEALLLRMLEKSPERRPSMAEIAGVFEALPRSGWGYDAAKDPPREAPARAASQPRAPQAEIATAKLRSRPAPSAETRSLREGTDKTVAAHSAIATPAPVTPPPAPPRPRRRRVLGLAIGGGVLVAGGIAAAVVATRGRGGDTGSGSATAFTCTASPPPTLEHATTTPALLRYQLAPGQRTALTLKARTQHDAHGGGVKHFSIVDMQVDAEVTWSAADPTGFTGSLRFKRVRIDSTGQTAIPGSQPHEIDLHATSEDKGTRDGAMLQAMTEVAIPIRISPRGELLEGDLRRLDVEAQMAGGTSEVAGMLTTDDLLRTAFVVLPEAAVSPGDRWDGAQIVKKLPPTGEASVTARYQVSALARDGSSVRALIVAAPDAAVAFRGQGAIVSQRGALAGWFVVEPTRGGVTSAGTKICIATQVDNAGQPTAVDVENSLDYTASSTGAP